MNPTPLKSILAALLLSAPVFAGENDKKAVAPAEPEAQPWRFSMAIPGWIPWVTGETGINGTNANLKLGPDDIVPKLDMIVPLRAEAHKGRFGIMGDYLYMSLSGSVGTPGMVKKLDIRMDQHLAEIALSWRVVESERGWLDVIGGVRYTNLYQRQTLHAEENVINETSQRLVDTVADRIASGVKERLVPLVQQRVANQLAVLQDRNPILPGSPIGDALRGLVTQRVLNLLEQRQAALRAAIQSGVPTRVNDAKAKLAGEIANALKGKLDTTVARTDDWWDPFVGLRGRYNLSKKYYLTGRGDIGGFGVGSELAWQINAGLGCQVTPNVFTEITYRLYDVNYRQNGFMMDALTHGPEITLGINF